MTTKTLSFFSDYKQISPVKFPKFSGTQVLMMPIIIGDLSSIPDSLAHYKPMLSELFKLQRHDGEIGYLTIDEKTIFAGKSHRRKGMHIDGMEPRNFPELFGTNEVVNASGSWGSSVLDDSWGIAEDHRFRGDSGSSDDRDAEVGRLQAERLARQQKEAELNKLPADEQPLALRIEELGISITIARQDKYERLRKERSKSDTEIADAKQPKLEQIRKKEEEISDLEAQLDRLKDYEKLKDERDALAKNQKQDKGDGTSLTQDEVDALRIGIRNELEKARKRKSDLEKEITQIPVSIEKKRKPALEKIERSEQDKIDRLEKERQGNIEELARIRQEKHDRGQLDKVDERLREQTHKWRERRENEKKDRGPGNGGGRLASPYTSGFGNGMLLVSSQPGCRVWKQWFDGVPGLNGECDHLRNQIREDTSEILAPNMVYWLDPFCIHESLEQPTDVKRQLLRLSLPSNCGWPESCTPNPLGIKATGQILPYRTQFMVDTNHQ